MCIALRRRPRRCRLRHRPSPYVYKKDEFKRTAETFNKEPTDRDEVTICYNGMGTTDKQVEAIAQQECGKFAKQAVATGETFGDLSADDADRSPVRLRRRRPLMRPVAPRR